MGRYTVMNNEMMKDPAVAELPIGGKTLYWYLLTSPFNNPAGYYRLTKAQLRVDLCREDEDSLSGFNEEDDTYLQNNILPLLNAKSKLWKYDNETKQVLIPNYLKYNKIAGPKQLPVLISSINSLSSSPLHILFLHQAKMHLRYGDYLNLWEGLLPSVKEYTQTLAESIKEIPQEWTAEYKQAAEIILETETPFD